MKVVNPDDTTHFISLIPRFYTINSITLSLYNEASQLSTDVSNTFGITDGILTISFDFSFEENDKYQFKLVESEVIYRDKLIATTQIPQEYKLTTGLYE